VAYVDFIIYSEIKKVSISIILMNLLVYFASFGLVLCSSKYFVTSLVI